MQQEKWYYYYNLQIDKQIYNMTSTAQQFEQLKQQLKRQENRKSQPHKIRMVNTIKWKIIMLYNLETLRNKQQFDRHLVDELKIIVGKISEQKFIEAIINMQPYKPDFKASTLHNRVRNDLKKTTLHHKFELSPGKESTDETKTSISSEFHHTEHEQRSAAKKKKEKYELFSTFIEQETLSRQLSSPNHPYSKIIEGFAYILEHKYKLQLQKQIKKGTAMEMDQLIESLRKDWELIEEFFKNSSLPIIDVFCISDKKERQKFSVDIKAFISNFLRNSKTICLVFRKILRCFARNSPENKQFQLHCSDNAEIQKFDIPEQLRIEGCFVYSTSELIQFSQLLKGKECLQKLTQVRQSIYKDIDQYNRSLIKQKAQVGSEAQLQIIKFLLTKLKIFSAEILAQLKYLQVIYGSNEMAFHFDQASYLHSQLLMAFQAIQLAL